MPNKILIVDSDQEQVEKLTLILEEEDFTVQTIAALPDTSNLDPQDIDLFIMRHEPTGPDGYRMLQELRHTSAFRSHGTLLVSRTPIEAFGFDESTFVDIVDGVLFLPFKQSELKAKLAHVMEKMNSRLSSMEVSEDDSGDAQIDLSANPVPFEQDASMQAQINESPAAGAEETLAPDAAMPPVAEETVAPDAAMPPVAEETVAPNAAMPPVAEETVAPNAATPPVAGEQPSVSPVVSLEAESSDSTDANPSNPQAEQMEEPNPQSAQGDAPAPPPPMLSLQERRFLSELFATVSHIDLNAPQVNASLDQYDGPERKILLLRQNLKERERQMAQIQLCWTKNEAHTHYLSSQIKLLNGEKRDLHARIQQQQVEQDEMTLAWEKKAAEFGRTLGEQFDSLQLREAELIQEVARWENEYNQSERRQRDALKTVESTEKELTQRIFEWEAAYKKFEEHHWELVGSWAEGIRQLVSQVDELRQEKAELRQQVHRAESAILTQRASYEKEHGLRQSEVVSLERKHAERAKGFQSQIAIIQGERFDLLEERDALKQNVFDLEISLERAARMLQKLAVVKRAESEELLWRLKNQESEYRILRDEYTSLLVEQRRTEQSRVWTATWGEAAISHLTRSGDDERWLVKAEVERRDQRVTDLKEKMAIQVSQITSLNNRLDETNADHKTLAEHASATETELRTVRSELAQISEEHRLQQVSFSEQQERLQTQLVQRTEALDAQRADSDDMIRSLRAKTAELESERAAQLSEHKEQMQLEVKLRRQIELEEQKNSNSEQILERKEKRIKELLDESQALNGRLTQAESEATRVTMRSAEQGAEIEARDQRLSVLEGDNAQLQEQLEEQKRHSEALAQDILESKNIQQETSQALEEARSARVRAEQEMKTMQEERASLESRLQESQLSSTQKEEDLRQMRADVEVSATIASDTQSQMSALEARNAELRDALIEKQDLYDDLVAKLDSLQVVKDEQSELTQKAKNAEHTLREENEELANALRALQSQQRETEENRLTINQDLEEVKQSRHRLDVELAELKGALQRTSEESALRESELQTIRTERDESVLALSQIQNRLEDMERESLSLKAQNSSLIEEQATLNAQLAHHAEDHASAGERAEEMEDSRAKQLAELQQLKAELDELRLQSHDYQQALSEQKEVVDERQASLESATQRATAAEERLREKDTLIHEQNEKLKELEKAHADALVQGEQVQAEQRQADDLERHFSEKLAMEKNRADALEDKTIALQRESEEASRLLAAQKAEYEQMQLDHSQLQESMNALRQEQAKAQAKEEELFDKIRELENAEPTSITNIGDAAALNVLSNENAQLKEKSVVLQSELEKARAEKAALKAKAEQKLREYATHLKRLQAQVAAQDVAPKPSVNLPQRNPFQSTMDNAQTREVRAVKPSEKPVEPDYFQNQPTIAALDKDDR